LRVVNSSPAAVQRISSFSSTRLHHKLLFRVRHGSYLCTTDTVLPARQGTGEQWLLELRLLELNNSSKQVSENSQIQIALTEIGSKPKWNHKPESRE